ncbi:SH3 domain-containing protein [Paeniglutamicibacter antarcticus]|uniref:SH3b domain-containing protein n=1 Tax=Paeniglutamicibacter antarcticus TaxID=494023 RepID=A0ABP9TVN4_9MICC
MPKIKFLHMTLAVAVLLSPLGVSAATAAPLQAPAAASIAPEQPDAATYAVAEKSSAVAYAASSVLPLADHWVLPLEANTYRATSSKGPRCIPVRGGSTEHLGQDLGTDNGAPIFAAAAGKVIKTRQGTNAASGYILIQHNVDGVTYTGAYYHMWSATTHVKLGSMVKPGQQIAKVGNSGPSTAPHLHFELWRGGWYQGTAVDPVPFVKARGVDLYANATTVYPDVRPPSCTYWLAEGTALRTRAAETGPVLKQLGKGTKVVAPLAAGTNKHLKVSADGSTGWIKQSVVTPNVVSAPPPVTIKNVNAYKNAKYMTTASLNMRSSARDGAVLRTLAKGTAVTATGLTALSEDWLQVKAGGNAGWVSKSYLSKVAAPKPQNNVKPQAVQKPPVAPKPAPTNKPKPVPPTKPKPVPPMKPAPTAKPKPKAKAAVVKYTVKANLHLRASAKTGKVLVTMKKGSTVTATGKKADAGKWIQVKSGSKTGWASVQYLSKQKASGTSAKPKPKPKATKAVTRKTTSGLNMRAGAGAKHKVVMVLKTKTTVQLAGKKSGKWVQVKVGKKTGWVSGAYLK